MRRWLAKRLRRFVERNDPQTYATPAVDAVVLPSADTFTVKRWANGRKWVLYSGGSATEAVRAWDMVRVQREGGKMEYWHNGVLRDTYQGQ